MFWDTFAGVYDLFENTYNGKVNSEFTRRVADRVKSTDVVLECACGTGLITEVVAPKCQSIVATDFSSGMVKKCQKKCSRYSNVDVKEGNIMATGFADESFDKVIAGNVVHLLDDPKAAIEELLRVCKSGGEVIIPTYVSASSNGDRNVVIKLLHKMGAGFKADFNYDSYQEFFKKMDYMVEEYDLVKGRMPNCIAIIKKP